MNEEAAKKVLKEVKEVLDAHNIEFWLNFGGLLGAVRNGRFIPYDDDVELNAWKHKVTERQMRDVSMELCRRGFNVYYSTLTDYISIRKYNVPIAFSMYTLRGDKAERPHENFVGAGLSTSIAKCFYCLSEVFARNRVGKVNLETVLGVKRLIIFLAVTVTGLLPENLRRKPAILFRLMSISNMGEIGRTRIPAKFYLELCDLKFYDMTFKVPRETEEYLKFVYGPQWKVPMENWNFYEHKSITGIEITDQIWGYK